LSFAPPCKLIDRYDRPKQVEIILDSSRNVKYFISGLSARTAGRNELLDR
jgi:hypothetical protein